MFEMYSIWDTAGQERYHALGPIYYRESNGALLVYDVTDPQSWDKVKSWVKELKKMLGNSCVLAIIGNKIDLLGSSAESSSSSLIREARDYTESLSTSGSGNAVVAATHCLTSAKNNTGIDDAFLALTKLMLAQA